MEDILGKILSKNNEVQDTVIKIKEKLEKMEATIRPHSSPYTLGRQDTPSIPKVFYGRDGDVASIVNFLSDTTTSRVCVRGPGGWKRHF